MTLFLETSYCLFCETQMRGFLENGDKATDCSSAWKASAGAEAKELRSQYDCGRKKRILGLSASHTTNDFNSPDFVCVLPFKKAFSLHMCLTPRDQGSVLFCGVAHSFQTWTWALKQSLLSNSFPNPGLFSSFHR